MAEPWMEGELKRQLGPVSAPADLWAAIHRPRRPESRAASLQWVFVPIAAMILLLAVAGILRSYPIDRTVQAGSAANCHTPNYAEHSITAVAAMRVSQESCLSCHLVMPSALVLTRP